MGRKPYGRQSNSDPIRVHIPRWCVVAVTERAVGLGRTRDEVTVWVPKSQLRGCEYASDSSLVDYPILAKGDRLEAIWIPEWLAKKTSQFDLPGETEAEEADAHADKFYAPSDDVPF